MWLGSTVSLQKGMESRRIARTRTARMEMRQVEPGVEKHKARWHAPADARCWSSAGTAGGSCCFGCGLTPRTACGLTSGPEMEAAPRPEGRGPDRELLTRGLVGHGRGGHVGSIEKFGSD